MTDDRDGIGNQLRAALPPETEVLTKEPLSRRTTLRVGGAADVYVEPATESDLAKALQLCCRQSIPVMILGRGSNLLVRDGGIRGVVIGLLHPAWSKVTVSGDHLDCGAGAKVRTVSREARHAGLSGLEFLEGIPGSVGGALRMNAGAMGTCMFQVVQTVRFMEFDGSIGELPASELKAGYRACAGLRTRIALGAVLKGQAAAVAEIEERTQEYNRKRWSTQPAAPSAGCVFKNPASIAAGRLIQELGLKGTCMGGAVISEVHGNFIVNKGGASAQDVLGLIALVRDKARAMRGIELETELQIVGEDPQ
jgi:UDP-N-acetylenolpyruvoylglucosamine reductase